MSSCSSSSNLRSQIFAPIVYVEASGSRISFNIDTNNTGYTIGNGITGGSVIRFDPNTHTYVSSDAKQSDTAEVVGVVESRTNIAGATVFTVVANGLMNYPNIDAIPDLYDPEGSCVAQTSLGGGAGGKDIFFLSDGCPGSLQTQEPSTPGAIVKPIIQRVKTSNSNAIVLNYIGYEVGEEAQAVFPISGLVGSVTYVIPGSPVPYGYLDVTNPVLVSVEEYPELYNVFGIEHQEYEEKVKITANPNPSWINATAIQYNNCSFSSGIYNEGTITEIDILNKTLTIKRSSTYLTTQITCPIVISNASLDIDSTFTPTIVKFSVPRPAPYTQEFTSNTSSVLVEMTPLIKAKNDLSYVSVTDNLILSRLSVGTINNVEATITAICADCDCCP
jgi:hypothetical protein